MVWLLALILIMLGIFLIILGILTDFREFEEDVELQEDFKEMRKEKRRKEVKAGGVIIVGPIPIVFGDSKYAFYALVLAIVLMVISIILMVGLNT
ncbi:TIGR00304 family membrane protein [Archaeoglobus sp.]